MKIAELKPYAKNPRRGDIEAIKESLLQFGQIKPITVREQTAEVLAGNHTRLAAQELGWTEIDTYVISVEDDDTAAKIVLADNRTSDLAGYDDETLTELLREIDSLDGTGYSAVDYAELLAKTAPIIAPEEDPAPAPKNPKTRRGDRIQLGEHVLICGDSSDAATVAELFGKDEADMVWTDPPYGVNVHEIANQRADRDWGEMNADAMDSPALQKFLEPIFEHAHEHAAAGAAIYVAHADQMREPVKGAFLKAGWSHRQTLVWVKNTLVIGRQDYQWKHEPILYGWKAGTHRWYGAFDKTTVIDSYVQKGNLEELERDELEDLVRALMGEPGTIVRIDKPSRSVDHPTMKPVDLVAGQISNSCPAAGIVYDPFGGSGSTLIAAEQTGRRARLIELEPAYCDVIVERWEQLSGKTASRPK
jgi:DNA modification methylase